MGVRKKLKCTRVLRRKEINIEKHLVIFNSSWPRAKLASAAWHLSRCRGPRWAQRGPGSAAGTGLPGEEDREQEGPGWAPGARPAAWRTRPRAKACREGREPSGSTRGLCGARREGCRRRGGLANRPPLASAPRQARRWAPRGEGAVGPGLSSGDQPRAGAWPPAAAPQPWGQSPPRKRPRHRLEETVRGPRKARPQAF